MAFCMAAKSSPVPFELRPVTFRRFVALEPVAEQLKPESELGLELLVLGLGLGELAAGLAVLRPAPPVLTPVPPVPVPIPPALGPAALAPLICVPATMLANSVAIHATNVRTSKRRCRARSLSLTTSLGSRPGAIRSPSGSLSWLLVPGQAACSHACNT
jgi:hypothetical protein